LLDTHVGGLDGSGAGGRLSRGGEAGVCAGGLGHGNTILDESVEVVSHKSLISLSASERRDSSSESNIDVNCLVSSCVEMGLLVVFSNSVGVNS